AGAAGPAGRSPDNSRSSSTDSLRRRSTGASGEATRSPPMMNAAFRQVIGAKDDERLELFLASARRLGTAVQNVEKDFWVCWVLDVLFNGNERGAAASAVQGRHVALEVVRSDRSLL